MSENLICNHAQECDCFKCPHKDLHCQLETRIFQEPNCIGAFCYYRNIPVECIEKRKSYDSNEIIKRLDKIIELLEKIKEADVLG